MAFRVPYFQRKTLRHAGCQIDYLIQIRQKTLAYARGMRLISPARLSLIQQGMTLRQLMRIPSREPMSDRLVADLLFRHWRNDLVVY
jgi:hypothetical protein